MPSFPSADWEWLRRIDSLRSVTQMKPTLDYLLMTLQSAQGCALMGLNSPGAAGRNRTIRVDQFLDEQIPLPPVSQQREIVRAFRTEERILQELLAKVRDAIDRFKELRTALISAAVTGKIDVRSAVAEDAVDVAVAAEAATGHGGAA